MAGGVKPASEFDETEYGWLLESGGPGDSPVFSGRNIRQYDFVADNPKGWATPEALRDAYLRRYKGLHREVAVHRMSAEDADYARRTFSPPPWGEGWEVRYVPHSDAAICIAVFYDRAGRLAHAVGCGFTREQCAIAKAEGYPAPFPNAPAFGGFGQGTLL